MCVCVCVCVCVCACVFLLFVGKQSEPGTLDDFCTTIQIHVLVSVVIHTARLLLKYKMNCASP